MNFNELKIFVGGIGFLTIGIWLFFNMLKDTRSGFRSSFGHDIQIYVASVMSIVLGCILIFKWLF